MGKRSRNMGRRALALGLAALTAAACAAPAAAAPISSGVAPTYDEAYYATLDYYGNLLEGSVVKSYALNGARSITDYGVYDQVNNLTDATPVSLGENSAAFRFDQSPSHFYFEGRTAAPFQNLPWTVTLRYTLNGVPVRAEELAGKTGVVEILLDIVPNPRASSYARYNYTLEAMALFNEDDILSLEAEGAQVQLVGNLRTVLFMCLPGEEEHFTIRVGSDDFSFNGMTILMVPATLAQLEEIAKLSQRKDDLEEDYEALSGSLDALLDALNDVQDGLYASASGLDQLDVARGTISKGKGKLYGDAGVLRGDLTVIADLLEPVEQRALALSQTITGSKAVLSNMTDTAVSLQNQLDDLEEALRGLESGASDVRQVIRGLADMKSSLRSLQRALGDSYIGGGSSGDRNTPKLSEQVEKTKQVGSAYTEKNEAAFMQKLLEAQGMSGEAAQKQIAQIGQLKQGLESGQITPDQLTAEQQAALKKASDMQNLHSAAQNGQISFRDFCKNLGVDDKTAKQMDDLWTIVKPAPSGSQAGKTMEAPAPDKSAQRDESTRPPEDAQPSEDAPEAETQSAPEPEEAPMPEETGDLDADTGSSGEPGSPSEPSGPSESSEPSSPSEPSGPSESSGPSEPAGDSSPAGDADPGAGGSSGGGTSSGSAQTPGGAAVDLIVGGLDDAMSQASAKIDAIQSELNSTINRITRPTGRVVGELAGLCDDVDDLVDLIDDAEDLSAALRQSSEKLQGILRDVDALRNILDEYEPTLQEAVVNVGSLSASAVSALQDLETLLADSEALMKTSGSQLDDGTRQALRGLAATLRQTARAMAATGDVRDAKATINSIIEDTWNEYTGDINNILLMDAEAEAVSLTDSRNPAPSSVQVLIRTQEIKTEELTAEQLAAAAPEKTTFWGRVAQMFRDFWKAVTSIFH